MDYYFKVLKEYANFDGRARRSEYWYFVLFNTIASVILGAADVATGLYSEEYGTGAMGMIYSLAVIIPSIAVGIRRMHDTGKSGWFILIPLYNLYLAIKEGDVGENQYGHDPKQEYQADDIADHLVD